MSLLEIITSIVLFIGAFLGIHKEPEIYSPCAPTIHYKLGSIDKKFSITEEKLLKQLDAATHIWEDTTNRDIFVYDEDGVAEKGERMITINMIYDERQRLNSQLNQLQGKVNNENKKVEANVADYEARVKNFNERSADLSERSKNLDINDPEYHRKFDEVFRESQALNAEADELNKLADSLNQSTDSYNNEVVKLNGTISRFNATLAEKPEEGVYNPNGDIIEIYIKSSDNELIHTLAHEFGHAIGMDHIDNEKAIMYPFTTRILKPSVEDISAIEAACKDRARE